RYYREADKSLAEAGAALEEAETTKEEAGKARDALLTRMEKDIARLERELVQIAEQESKAAAKRAPQAAELKALEEQVAAAKKADTAANKAVTTKKEEYKLADANRSVAILALCRTSLVHQELDSDLTNWVTELAGAAATESQCRARAGELREKIREVVERVPTGHTTAKIDPERVYKAWLNLAGKVGAYLQLSPAYVYDLAELLQKRFSLQVLQEAGALKIDRMAMEKTAKAGNLKDAQGKTVALEELQEAFLRFDPDAFTPKVVPIISDTPLLDVVTNFRPGDIRPLEESGLEPRLVTLIRQHAGATTVQEVMSMPAAKLAGIPGIGPVGYAKILKGLSGKPHYKPV
ncbi:MAG: hypothetical protein Q8R28_01915, partial [Dehalococcoidia bacterium]|nr:hypothetical protein [Dehalococcoidia bacterium]